MKKDPSGPFITSLLELKLDQNTLFEWQKFSQDCKDVPSYTKLLEFINLRAQASESCSRTPRTEVKRQVHSFTTITVSDTNPNCVACKSGKHPLYACQQFKAMPQEKKFAIVKDNNLCLNCLRPGHIAKGCKSNSHCKKCQRPHHTFLHVDHKETTPRMEKTEASQEQTGMAVDVNISSNTQAATRGSTLLMTCQVLIHAPDGSSVRARGLLDSGSSASFVSERMAQTLRLKRSTRNIQISGVAGITHCSPIHSISTFEISSLSSPSDKIDVSAIVVPQVTRHLPIQPIQFKSDWTHLSGLYLSDPDFGRPGRIDILLGVDIYAAVMLQGRRSGPRGTPFALETKFGWVLAGETSTSTNDSVVETHHITISTGDDILRKFWEIEESPKHNSNYSPEEQAVVTHFNDEHHRTKEGRFVIPLPKNPQAKPLGESRSQAVRRFMSLERSLQSKNQFSEFAAVMEEYMELGHAELVPVSDLQKPSKEVFYMPMHAVRKEHSTTTKIRAVFDASAKTNSGVSLNDTLLIGPTVHSSLIDVLLRFRLNRIALTTDVSKMYRAVELAEPDRDLHRFVWRNNPTQPLQDFRMTRVTFGVSASPFAANMALKQNAIDHTVKYPLAAQAVHSSFYVDDGLTGADSVEEAIELQDQLQNLFSRGGFLLRKWNSSDPNVLSRLPDQLKDSQPEQTLPISDQYTKTLGIAWNASKDHFRLTICEPPPLESITKRALVSDIAKTYDVLGWFSPTIIKAKILLQQLWERRVDWDQPVPIDIRDAWLQWRSELARLAEVHIPRCYFDKRTSSPSIEIHGFCDASEVAYAATVYLRISDDTIGIQTSLVLAKTKVAPIKKLTIPRLELCGASLLAQLLHHVKGVLNIPLSKVHAWTDSTIVLNWLDGNPRRFKTYVGNRISTIITLIPPDKWKHVKSAENPADCASGGLFPSELIDHSLWWNGPLWLKQAPDCWPEQTHVPFTVGNSDEISLIAKVSDKSPIIDPTKFSSFNHLKQVTAWVMRFIHNCQKKSSEKSCLTTQEVKEAETYWLEYTQYSHFVTDIKNLQSEKPIPKSSPLLSLQPFMDHSTNLLRVGGRQQLAQAPFSTKHPIVLHGKDPITRMIIRDEHLRLLHAGPTLLASSLARRYHIVGGSKIVRSVTRECLICRKYSARPQQQQLGQLPIERITPGPIFDTVGIDYAGPILTKYGYVRKPTIVKSYVCVFVSLTVKAVHLELVSDLTTEAFIACLKRFIARRGLPSLIWSDNGTNFTGAARELKELHQFLQTKKLQENVTDYLSFQGITWKFNPQYAPHFGGIWEAAVKSMKTHLRKIVGEVRLNYEELSTVLTQIESCMNSRPLVPLSNDQNGIEALTPGHFLINRPLKALPDILPDTPISLLKRWQLCKALLRHFWKRWSTEYLTHLSRHTKWQYPTRNIKVGDLVILREDSPIINQWPLARVIEVHPGKDKKVRVATIKTQNGIYTRPIVKLALLLPNEEQHSTLL